MKKIQLDGKPREIAFEQLKGTVNTETLRYACHSLRERTLQPILLPVQDLLGAGSQESTIR